MILFAASLAVAIFCVPFNRRQTKAYVKEYTTRLGAQTSSHPIALGLSPKVLESWFERGLDTAANFPAFILMVIAFSESKFFQNDFAVAALIFVSALGVYAMVVRIGPEWSGSFAPKGFSLWTIFIGLLSVAGLTMEIYEYWHTDLSS